MTTLDQILKNKIVAIIRGADPADVLRIADALQLRECKYPGGHS